MPTNVFGLFIYHLKLNKTVSYKNSSGFLGTNYSVKHIPFLYLLTFVLAIKPLLFLYNVPVAQVNKKSVR